MIEGSRIQFTKAGPRNTEPRVSHLSCDWDWTGSHEQAGTHKKYRNTYFGSTTTGALRDLQPLINNNITEAERDTDDVSNLIKPKIATAGRQDFVCLEAGKYVDTSLNFVFLIFLTYATQCVRPKVNQLWRTIGQHVKSVAADVKRN